MDSNGGYKAHCLFVPHPTQGHINPMLQFAKRLNQKRVYITLALTKFLLKSTTLSSLGESVSVRSISDGFDSGGRSQARSSEEYQARFEQIGRQTLADLLRDLDGSDLPVDCVVYDPFMPWVLDVAKGAGRLAAAFFTQSCTVDSIYYRVYNGELRLPLAGGEEAAMAVPWLAGMKPEDMPSFVYDYGSCPGTFQMVLNQFRNVDKADWIFINTFDKLEEEALKWMSRFRPLKAVGPTLPSVHLDRRLPDDLDYGFSILPPHTAACLDWLDRQPPKSTIYVSFGSLAQLTTPQTEELAWALGACGRPFLWVLRPSEASKLPAAFSKETAAGKGIVVAWAPQLAVLAHAATGCFVTHCGWNSTLEGLGMGVPMVAMPQWTDQSTNAKLVADVWGVGIRAGKGEDGLVGREEIARCVERVIGGGAIRSNAVKWREVAREAVDEGGSSDLNIHQFVKSIAKVF